MKNENRRGFLEVIMSRRSVREFEVGNIPLEDVKQIILAGIMAPSAGNSQPWRFHVVMGKTKQKFVEVLGKTRTLPPLHRQVFTNVLKTVSLVIVVENKLPANSGNVFPLMGTSASIENMLLAIHSMGYGSVWIGFPPIVDAAKRIIRPTGEIIGILPVGYPAEQQSEYVNRERMTLEEVTKFYD